ncbi:MAG: geranyl transferase [Gammaproteobacteria bacterium]|nr:geranyl transferase [Gammaproteobacteria bacterium]
MPNPESLDTMISLCRHRIEAALDQILPAAATPPETLHEAMRYSTLAGGKYVRPLLVYCAGQACDVPMARLDAAACAVELIHAYSLIHDDLPAMDDDALRRGRPTCHIAYGEAMAILAGDALQALAFHVLAHENDSLTPHQRLRMMDTLAYASGSLGMAGGQAIDMQSIGRTLDVDELENMHTRKTGALIQASILLGGLAADPVDEQVLQQLGGFGRCIGLAFQIRDDILDVESATETLGKPQGSDEDMNKPTYTSLLGLEGAHEKLREVHDKALHYLDGMGPKADYLRQVAEYIVGRKY